MKKLSKILAVIASLCLLLAAVVSVAYASGESIEGKYVVNGTGYETFEEAAATAGGRLTVKVNEDIVLTKSIEISGAVILDLGGKSITVDAGAAFVVQNGGELVLRGVGSINANQFVQVKSGAKLVVQAYADGISITDKGALASVFQIERGASAEFSGDITFTPTTNVGGGVVFDVGVSELTECPDENAEKAFVNFSGANITVKSPSNGDHYNTAAIYFMNMYDGANVSVKNSLVEVKYGNMFNVLSGLDSTLETTGSGVKADAITEAHPGFSVNLDVDDSKLWVGTEKYCYLHQPGNVFGMFMTGADEAIYATLDNVDLKASNKIFLGARKDDGKAATLYYVGVNQIIFNNVSYAVTEYTPVTTGSSQQASLVRGRVNLLWNGGSIKNSGLVYTQVASIPAVDGSMPFDQSVVASVSTVALDPAIHVVKIDTEANTWTYYSYAIDTNTGKYFSYGGLQYSAFTKEQQTGAYTKVDTYTDFDLFTGICLRNVSSTYTLQTSRTSFSSDKNAWKDNVFTRITESSSGSGTGTPTYGPASGNVMTSWPTGIVVTSTFNPTTEGGEAAPAGALVLSSNNAAQETAGYTTKDGNGYYKWAPITATGADATSNIYMRIGYNRLQMGIKDLNIDGAGIQYFSNDYLHAFYIFKAKASYIYSGTTGQNLRKRHNFVVHEFDVATDSGKYPTTDVAVEIEKGVINDAGDDVVGAIANLGLNLGKIENGKVVSSAAQGVTLETTGTPYVLPTDGTWSRYTYVYEIGEWTDAGTYEVAGYTRSQSTLAVKIHFFVNGVWQATASNFMLPVDTALHGSVTAKEVRLDPHLDANSSLCIDNPRVSYYEMVYAGNNVWNIPDGTDSLATLCANPKAGAAGNPEISYHPDNNTSFGDVVANVDGVDYTKQTLAMGAVKDGSVLKLLSDFTSKIYVDKSFTVDLNGHSLNGFVSETHVGIEYGGKMYFIPAAKGEIIDVVYKSEPYEKAEPGKATLGSSANPEVNLYEGEFILDGAKYKKVISWTDPNDDGRLAFDEMTDGKIILVPVYLYEQLSFEINKNGEISYYSASDGDITEEVNALVADGSVIAVKLYVDTVSENAVSIVVPKDGKLYFDLNGNTFISNKHNVDAPVFSASENSEFYLYSSKEGGSLVASVASVENNIAARVKGGSVWVYAAASATADGQGAKAYFGSVKNEALGIDAVGTNLTVVAAEIAKAAGFGVNETPAFAGLSAEIGVVGGTYVRFTDDGAASFSAGVNTTLNVGGATLVGCGPHFATDGGADAKLTLNVENSAIVVTDETLVAVSSESIFGDFSASSSASLSGSVVFGAFGGNNVTLGSGMKLASENLGGAQLGEGLILANAKAEEFVYFSVPAVTVNFTYRIDENTTENLTLSYKDAKTDAPANIEGISVAVSAVADALSAGGFVTAYIDAPEKLAKLTFYDSDNTTVIGESYNAPFGEIVVDPAFGRAVHDTFGNEWWRVGFSHWNLPELAAGEYQVFPVCDSEVADVKCLDVNITLYTNFRFNYYLPATYEEGFTLIGVTSDAEGQNVLPFETVEVDGVKLVMFYEYVDSYDAAAKDRYIHFVYESTSYVQKITFGVEYYANAILGDTEEKYSDGAKSVAANAARYANESCKEKNGAGHAGLEAILAANSDKLIDFSAIQFTAKELDVDISALSGIATAGFGKFDGSPAFMLVYDAAIKNQVKLPDAPDGGFAEWPANNAGYFTYVHYKNYVGFEKEAVLSNESLNAGEEFNTHECFNAGSWDGAAYVVSELEYMRIEDLTSVINFVVYKPDGTVVRASYSLARFITDNGADSVLEAAYALSLAAQDYVKNP